MAYYAVFDTDIFDSEGYKEYQAKVGAGSRRMVANT
jgi:hypothetical protein